LCLAAAIGVALSSPENGERQAEWILGDHSLIECAAATKSPPIGDDAGERASEGCAELRSRRAGRRARDGRELCALGLAADASDGLPAHEERRRDEERGSDGRHGPIHPRPGASLGGAVGGLEPSRAARPPSSRAFGVQPARGACTDLEPIGDLDGDGTLDVAVYDRRLRRFHLRFGSRGCVPAAARE